MALAMGGVEHQVFPVVTKAEFTDALDQGGFDVILSDSGLPGFVGKAALEIAKGQCPEVPFLFVSGHYSPGEAVRLKGAGAAAAISKSNLKALADAVLAALKIERPA